MEVREAAGKDRTRKADAGARVERRRQRTDMMRRCEILVKGPGRKVMRFTSLEVFLVVEDEGLSSFSAAVEGLYIYCPMHIERPRKGWGSLSCR